jgi:hypothetical protein
MKKYIAVLLLFAVLLTAGCTALNPDETNPKATSEEGSKLLDMREANPLITDEKMPIYDRMISILAQTSKRLETAETVELELNYFTQEFARLTDLSGEKRTESDKEITAFAVSSDLDKQKMQYMLLLHTLTTEYAECVYFIDEDYDSYLYDRLMFRELFVTDEYKAAGYDNAKDYYLAIRDGLCEAPKNAYYVSFDGRRLTPYDRATGKDILPEMLEAAEELNK